MLRTNSKQARENLKKYIVDNFDPSNYDDITITNDTDFAEIAKAIYNTFKAEKPYKTGYKPEAVIFEDWAQGLPSILDTCYYYNRSAIDDLSEILEQTETEKAKYKDERAAEKLLTNLIYREITKAL